MDRRTAISRIGVMLGGALSASTLSALVSGCSTPAEEGFTPSFLSSDQLERIARMSNAVIPDTDTPGARVAGVHRFIDTLLAEYHPRPEAETFRSMLDEFTSRHDIDALSDEALVKRLTEVDRLWSAGQEDRVWAGIKQWTIAGYYTSEVGMTQELRMMPFTEARMDMPRSEIERTWA
ncbi:MAG: gluconate 2-dehydrogenase subunit 3 family protein [Rhodothermales bacterium]